MLGTELPLASEGVYSVNEEAPRQRIVRVLRILFWIHILAMSFDYKVLMDDNLDTGGSSAQILILLVSVSAAVGILLLRPKYLLTMPGVFLLLLWGIGIVGGVLAALLNHVSTGHMLRMGLPPCLLWLSLASTCIVAAAGIPPREIALPLIVGWSLSVAWRFASGFLFFGATLETARVEILSPAIPLVVAFAVATLLLRKKPSLLIAIPVVISVFVVFISVTRTFLLVSAAVSMLGFVTLFLAVYWGAVPQGRALWRTGLCFGSITAVLLGIGVLAALSPENSQRWVSRITNSHEKDLVGADPSLLMRLAENKDIIERATASGGKLFFGNGYGASYGYHTDYIPMLEVFYNLEQNTWLLDERWVSPDSTWFYNLLTGGIFGLGIVVCFFAYSIGIALWAAYLNARLPGFDTHGWVAFVPVLSIAAMLVMTLLFNPLGERFGALSLGLIVGLSQASLFRAQRHRTARRQARRISEINKQRALQFSSLRSADPMLEQQREGAK